MITIESRGNECVCILGQMKSFLSRMFLERVTVPERDDAGWQFVLSLRRESYEMRWTRCRRVEQSLGKRKKRRM